MQTLSKLPDTYTLINDYRLQFGRPIHDKRNDDWIYSVQIDHILVGPTGLYLIETKNWSKDSMRNPDLLSPVTQVRRHGFAMFVLLNEAVRAGGLVFTDHWAARKISPKNVILFAGYQPEEKKEYQFVKIVLMSEILDYVSYGRKVFNKEEAASLLSCLDHLKKKY